MNKIVIFGSTGSLGKNMIKILRKYPEIKIAGLSAYSNGALLRKQAKDNNVPEANIVLAKKENHLKLLELKNINIIANFIPGIEGSKITKTALKKKIKILLGNKECIVGEGKAIMARSGGVSVLSEKSLIFPVDSEINAIYEILKKWPDKDINRIIIPCSGGRFWEKSEKELKEIDAKSELMNPKWKMGKKITLESALMLNKGFEIIEAHFLFNIPIKKIRVLIHPDCLLHGIVWFQNEKYPHAYIAKPDMKEHIENALLRSLNRKIPKINIKRIKLSDYRLFNTKETKLKGMDIVVRHFKKNPENMKVFIKKEEKAIDDFFNGKLKFLDICEVLK